MFGTGYIQVLYLGRAPRTKETLPDFCEKCRVTRHSRVFRGLTGSQWTLGFWGVTHPGFAHSNAMKKCGSFAYDLWKSPNKVVNAICFPPNAFLYDISYPNFSIMVSWIAATDKVNCALIIALI